MSPDSSPLLECSQLTQVYRVGRSEIIALQGLDLTVEPGEMIGVIGASGSGKSTLMQVVSGLLRPTGGRVSVDGLDLGAATGRQLDDYRRRDLGFVWQDPTRTLVPYLSAAQNVSLPLELTGVDGSRMRARDMLDRVGLADRCDHRPSELSGGEQQRVALATALVHEPRLLLADEPTGALDSATTQEVFDLMRALGTELGLTQIIVSHDPEVARHVDRVVAIRDGRVASEHRWTETDDGLHRIDESLVIDSIGRVQLRDDHREALGDVDRVTAEVVNGVLELRPVDPGGDTDGHA